MSMRASRRLECESQLKRPPQERHISTFTMPFEKSVHSVPYYARKKRQLRARNYIHNQEQRTEQQSEVKSLQASREDPQRRRTIKDYYITEVTVEPVVNDNKFTNFNPDSYPLNQSEKVKVVDDKYFPLQNYYNYICAMKSQEQVFRLAQTTKNILVQVIKRGYDRDSFFNPAVSADMDQKQKVVKQTMKIKGLHESKFDPSGGRFRSVDMSTKTVQLSPVHFQYQNSNSRRNVQPFDVKECERESIIQQVASKSRKR